MLAATLQRLVRDRLTTVKEMAEVTGRGESTVYRWIGGTSQPNYDDLHHLACELNRLEARQALLSLLVQGLPVEVRWRLQDDSDQSPAGGTSERDALELALHGLQAVTEVLRHQQEVLRHGRMSADDAAQIVQLIDRAINDLLGSKHRVLQQVTRRRKARHTSTPPPSPRPSSPTVPAHRPSPHHADQATK